MMVEKIEGITDGVENISESGVLEGSDILYVFGSDNNFNPTET